MLVAALFPYLMNTSQLIWQCIHITVMSETGTNYAKEHLLIAILSCTGWKTAFFILLYIVICRPVDVCKGACSI